MKKTVLYVALFCFGIAGMGAEAATFSFNFPRLTPDPEIALLAKPDDYTWQELYDISIWASGAKPGEAFNEKIKQMTEKLSADFAANNMSNPKEKAEYILSFLHKNYFKSYSLNQTRIDTLLATGRYNCVSSAVLYVILAKNAGFDVSGVITKDHAFVAVNFPDESIDVETTNPYGFDPGKKKEFQDNFGKATGFAYTAPGNYRNRQIISQIELVSIIIRNRIADLEKANKYAEAVPLAVDRAAMLQGRKNPTTSDLFVDPIIERDDNIFNLGAYYLNRGKEAEAFAWADYSAPIVQDKKRQHDFVFSVMNNMLAKEIRAKKIDALRATLNENANRFDTEDFKHFETMVVEAELTQIINKATSDPATVDALKKLDEAEKNGLVDQKRLEEFKKVVLANRVSYFHNNFAALFNKKDYAAAEAVLEAALREFPDNKQLANDKKSLSNMQARLGV